MVFIDYVVGMGLVEPGLNTPAMMNVRDISFAHPVPQSSVIVIYVSSSVAVLTIGVIALAAPPMVHVTYVPVLE